jgi:hypothetical protein
VDSKKTAFSRKPAQSSKSPGKKVKPKKTVKSYPIFSREEVDSVVVKYKPLISLIPGFIDIVTGQKEQKNRFIHQDGKPVLCIKVFLEKKMKKAQLSNDAVEIPDELDGIPTDVLIRPTAKALAGDVAGGDQIFGNGGTGTATIVVTKQMQTFLLTAGHVGFPADSDIKDAGGTKIGVSVGGGVIDFPLSKFDAMLIKLEASVTSQNMLVRNPTIGSFTVKEGQGKISDSDDLFFLGATSGKIVCTLDSLSNLTINLSTSNPDIVNGSYDVGNVFSINCARGAEGGDSGSPILRETTRADGTKALFLEGIVIGTDSKNPNKAFAHFWKRGNFESISKTLKVKLS